MTSYFYLIHWNIQGSKNTFSKFIDNVSKIKQPTLLSLNEVNNDIIRLEIMNNVDAKAIDLNVKGYKKKSNQIFVNLIPINIQFVGKQIRNGFYHRMVMSKINIKGKEIIVFTAHSPFGSGKNTNTSGSKVKALFYRELLDIIKKVKPHILTIDANEPEEYANGIFNQMVFYDNKLNKSNEPEAYLFFKYLFKNYHLFKSQDPTYKDKYYDHIYYKNVKILKSAPIFDNAIKEHSSDHKPVVVKIEV
jgi:hypothetical protein